MSKVITANMLATGRVVFAGTNNAWVESISEAAVFADEAAAQGALAQAQLDQERAIIVDPFVTARGSGPDDRRDMTLRETIRAYGPTISYQPHVGRAGSGAGHEKD